MVEQMEESRRMHAETPASMQEISEALRRGHAPAPSQLPLAKPGYGTTTSTAENVEGLEAGLGGC